MRITIPDPCAEDWSSMSAEEQGRHCMKCSKTVVDFTKMSDGQLLRYFQSHQQICGRFSVLQLNRDIASSSHSRLRMHTGAIAAACTILLTQPLLAQDSLQMQQTDSGKSVNSNLVLPHFFAQKTIRIAIEGTDSGTTALKQLRCTNGSFSIDTVPDASHACTYQIPDSVAWQNLELLLTDFRGDTFHISIPSEQMQAGPNAWYSSPQIRLYSLNGRWRYAIVWPLAFVTPPVYMGIPPLHYEFERFKEIRFDNVKINAFVLGDTIADTPAQLPVPMEGGQSPNANIQKMNASEKQNHPWMRIWLLGFASALTGFYVWRKRLRKRKHSGGTASSEQA